MILSEVIANAGLKLQLDCCGERQLPVVDRGKDIVVPHKTVDRNWEFRNELVEPVRTVHKVGPVVTVDFACQWASAQQESWVCTVEMVED